jgi:ubiquinone biosynthesis protein Coq4
MGRLFILWQHLGSIGAVFMLGRRPDQLKYVFMIGDRQDNLTEVARAAGRITDPFADAALGAIWTQRYHPARYDLHELARLPEDTLGGACARFMLAHGLKSDFYENVEARHKTHYLRLRLRQTHEWSTRHRCTDATRQAGALAAWGGPALTRASGTC